MTFVPILRYTKVNPCTLLATHTHIRERRSKDRFFLFALTNVPLRVPFSVLENLGGATGVQHLISTKHDKMDISFPQTVKTLKK